MLVAGFGARYRIALPGRGRWDALPRGLSFLLDALFTWVPKLRRERYPSNLLAPHLWAWLRRAGSGVRIGVGNAYSFSSVENKGHLDNTIRRLA